MLEAIIANLISWVLIGVITIAFLVLAPGIARLWVECWARLHPNVADQLRDHFQAEMEIDKQLQRILRALLFTVTVPHVARALGEAERDPLTKTNGTVETVTEVEDLIAFVNSLDPLGP